MATIKVFSGLLKTTTHPCLKPHSISIFRNDFNLRDNLWQQIRTIKAPGKRRGLKYIAIRSTPKELPLDPNEVSQRPSNAQSAIPTDLAELRFAYPEFLPKPVVDHRDKLCEQLMRKDLIRRRNVIEIPEFYVGSILAVTISDPYAPGKISKFVGICIERAGQGTDANFTLRNRADGQGVEIRYDLYNPTIREIQVLRLEKRLDPHLLYLRDALPEYSEVPFDMTPDPPLPSGTPVPLNAIKVVMKKHPWTRKWEAVDLQGIQQLTELPDFEYINKWRVKSAYAKYDLMKEYRETIPEEEQLDILKEIQEHKDKVAEVRAIERRKKLVQQTSKKS
ncbi:39S ribosomal protein L19, mitochondrial-like [Oppia nitens]|uniref:39S ribosomal protein L19, mitochondrial-like n=1 Tax=Oppia nitens TaxID=1686743 RepID=UPI0023DA86DD|nr:39S ribosomal protein L19, mitochondrial-like [Oppia nitens]